MPDNTIEKSLFINFSKAKLDVTIAEDIINHLRATRAFKDQNIQDSSSYAGDETDKSLMRKVDESYAVIHLLSSDFQNENCSKAFDKCIEIKKRMFPVLIRRFPYEYDQKLMSIMDELLPDDKKDIDHFVNEADRDMIITMTIEKIYERLGITRYQPSTGRNRKKILFMIACFTVLGLILVSATFTYTGEWLFSLIPLAGTLIIIGYLFSILKNPFSISLYKSPKT